MRSNANIQSIACMRDKLKTIFYGNLILVAMFEFITVKSILKIYYQS